jgi:hypothetical protein
MGSVAEKGDNPIKNGTSGHPILSKFHQAPIFTVYFLRTDLHVTNNQMPHLCNIKYIELEV